MKTKLMATAAVAFLLSRFKSDLWRVALANATSRRASEAIRACTLSFFNKHLKGEDDHLLDNPTNRFPAIFNYLTK